ncbi:MAG: HD domain-containing protein [Lachnospiraceae bacterium]|nr:HD domain-containing protein [Lachnospiraceae bacterium]
MIFVKTDDLKTGMRLARPVYNKNGVLLYERDSKLTYQGITSIKNFGLIGIFVLEPAEPVPPMTEDDIYFERFQTIYVFAIKEELDNILQTKRQAKMQSITANIIKNYGHLDRKIYFMQNLRSKEDYTYKHSLNVAMLCAMIAHTMNITVGEQLDTVTAAIVHDIGKLAAPKEVMMSDNWTELEKGQIKAAEIAGFGIIEQTFAVTPNIKRICMQAQKNIESLEKGEDVDNSKMIMGARILSVAETFDTMTAMQIDKPPASEVAALKYLMQHPDYFDEKVVKALIDSVKILFAGVSIELNTGEKGLVLSENPVNVLKPMILTYTDNKLIDLYSKEYDGKLEIVDIMKTMDNRHIVNRALMEKFGIKPQEKTYTGASPSMEEQPSGEDNTQDGETEEYVPGAV